MRRCRGLPIASRTALISAHTASWKAGRGQFQTRLNQRRILLTVSPGLASTLPRIQLSRSVTDLVAELLVATS